MPETKTRMTTVQTQVQGSLSDCDQHEPRDKAGIRQAGLVVIHEMEQVIPWGWMELDGLIFWLVPKYDIMSPRRDFLVYLPVI
jgi:hypothetical protein